MTLHNLVLGRRGSCWMAGAAIIAVGGCGDGASRAPKPTAPVTEAVQNTATAERRASVISGPCPVTARPSRAFPKQLRSQYGAAWHGRGDLFVAVQPPKFDDVRMPDGSYGVKVAWFRRRAGTLSVEVRRLDGPGRGKAATSDEGYPPTGPLPTGVELNAAGCWQLTGQLDDDPQTTIRAVMLVVDPRATGDASK